jgi:hypothetical protein
MEESATVEETQTEQESAEDASTVEGEIDPQEKLCKVIAQEEELAELEAKMQAQRQAIQREKDVLNHTLATALLEDYLVGCAEFARQFTDPEGEVFKRYDALQRLAEKIKSHDPSFPKSLGEGRYSVDVEDFQFWLGMSQKYIGIGEPLEKLLRGIYGGRVHGTPFSNED